MMQRNTAHLSLLDQYLAGTMQQSAELERRLLSAGVSWIAARDSATLLLASAPLFRDPFSRARDEIIRLFGQPAVAKPNRLLYDSSLWPDHWYQWRFGSSGRATDQRLVRRDESLAELTAPITVRKLRQMLVTWRHTEKDVRSVLGVPPIDEDSWWPATVLTYRVLEDSGELKFVFEHGVLSSMEEPA